MKRNKAWFHYFAYHACAGFTVKIVCCISCIPFLASTSSPSFSLSKKTIGLRKGKILNILREKYYNFGMFLSCVPYLYFESLAIYNILIRKKDLTYSLLLFLVFRRIERENHLLFLSGKPNRLMFDIVRKRHPSVDPSRTLMIGDRWRSTECSE